MNYFQIYKELRKHLKLAEKRSFDYNKNKAAKYIMYGASVFMIIYMMFLAVCLSMVANNIPTFTPLEVLFGLLPFFLLADFLFRFMGQQTPSQLVKPYSLLPLPKYSCIDCFLINAVLSPTQLLWMAITVPFAIMSLLFVEGFWMSVFVIFVLQLFFSANAMWYVLVRSLITKSLLWWVLPIGVYATAATPWIFKNFKFFFQFYAYLGEHLWLAVFIVAFILLPVLFFVNRKVQYDMTYRETAEEASSEQIVKAREFTMFERFGILGEFLKLEIKTNLRNKNPRKTLVFACVFSVILSCLIAYTDIYDQPLMQKFWIVYIFVLTGCMQLVKIMSAEGNYIDGLMVHKEQINNMLRAKYFFYCAMLILPFVILLPTVFIGKYTLLMLTSMMIFTAGPIFCMLMQLAVYNRQTLPLNAKLISKGNVESNWFMVIAELVAMFSPVAFISILSVFFSDTVTYIILMIIGLLFIATNKLWIRNIYNRFMAKRYVNMEGFRSSR